MTYDIFKRTAPTMPTPGKGTKIVGFLLSKASKDMQEALLPMIMPALSAHLTDVEFLYSDGKYYPMCGQMGHQIGPSGVGKAQLTHLVEAVLRVNLTMSSTPDAAHNTLMLYTKKELALMYFPDSSLETAVKHLRRWILHCPELHRELQATGYRATNHNFTARQTELIEHYLGCP